MKSKAIMALAVILVSTLANAADIPVVELTIQDHRFTPAEVTVPAGTKVKLQVSNRDASPEEFESHELNREKVIPGGQQAVIFIGPLKPGKYPFFGEYHEDTAKGVIIVK
jgi:plastocyanin